MSDNPINKYSLFLNNRGTAMLFVLVLAVISSIVIASVSFTSRYTIKKSGDRRGNVALFNIVEAGKEDGIAKIRSRAFDPVAGVRTTIHTVNNFGGGSYTVSCSASASLDTVSIISTGTLGTKSKSIEVIAFVGPDAWKKWVKGAVTARIGVQTLGNIEIDGRDYDTTGGAAGTLLTPVRGTYGVCSGGTVSVDGSSQIGGNTTAPTGTKVPGVTVLENIDTTGYPTTPEEVLGLPPGALNGYKKTSCPSVSGYGIVYTEGACNLTGGILICHNSTGTASLDNYHGTFRGLIIADEDKHINGGATILGAVIFLGKKAGGNCIGNGGATIHYSSKMLNKAMQVLAASGPRIVTVLSWREVQ